MSPKCRLASTDCLAFTLGRKCHQRILGYNSRERERDEGDGEAKTKRETVSLVEHEADKLFADGKKKNSVHLKYPVCWKGT